ncbi:autotransporter domain-containing protein [Arsenicitalea aurantiaca]|nr:autotransporter outer membrane beta-barrel domain-containing protein [Arsenicitalea aurantiaca]
MKKTNRNLRARAAARRAALPNLQGVVPARLGRIGLLSGTAIATGAFAGLAGMVALPTPAMAQWATTNGGLNYVAAGAVGPGSFTAPGNGWLTSVGYFSGGEESATVTNNSAAQALLINAQRYDGIVYVSPNSTITSTGGSARHGILVTPGTLGAPNTARPLQSLTFNIEGDVDTSGAPGGDALRINGSGNANASSLNNAFNIDITVAETGSLVGGDDGVQIVGLRGTLNLTNHGLIQGTGNSGVPSEGFQVLQNGVLNTPVAGNINLINTGEIYGSRTTAAGDAVLLSTTGNVSITNTGTIEGGISGIDVSNAGLVEIFNHSYGSVIGDVHGIIIPNADQVRINNSGGLVGGLTQDGIFLNGVSGDGTLLNGNSVVINNSGLDKFSNPRDGGVIAGNIDGIDIDNVASGNILINNSSSTFGEITYTGGLIVGVTNDGIDIAGAGGNVVISNTGTRGGQIDQTDLDPEFNPDVFVGLLDGDQETPSPVVAGPNLLYTGIWGLGRHGIVMVDVEGFVGFDNTDGLLVGHEDGLRVIDVEGVTGSDAALATDIDDFAGEGFVALAINNTNGMMWGGDDGLRGDNLDGSVFLLNDGGTVFGGENAIDLSDIWQGNVYIQNNGGTIQGLYDDAIRIREVDRSDGNGGGVFILNGAIEDGTGALIGGGKILSGDSAISISDARTAAIANGASGWIIGDGGSGQAVISLSGLSRSGSLGEEGATVAGASVVNDGIIASRALPGFVYSPDPLDETPSDDWTLPDKSVVRESTLDLVTLNAQLLAFENYVLFGGDMAQLDSLSNYEDVANDRAIQSEDSGATHVVNRGQMFGRVNLDGRNGAWNTGVGNTIDNAGTWFVTGWNGLSGGINDVINNSGWIQSAFDNDDDEWTGFRTNRFNNSGVLSLVDGAVDDRMMIRGNFAGSGSSLLALDVDLADADADRLRLRDGTVTGQTGIIVRLVNGDNGEINERIELVSYDDWETLDTAFVLSAYSDNYIEIGGRAYIEDGLLAWFLEQDYYDRDFDLVSGWGPGAVNAPRIITGAQTVFYETLGVVEDHIYGGQFAAGGGGGADLLYLPEAESSAPAGRQGGVWAKATGSWTDRDTTVTLDGNPDPFDTSSEQDVYSVIGGVDFKPGGIGSPFRIGVFGGYVASDLSFALGEDGVVYEGGLVGAYAAYNDGALFADVTVKADLLNATYSFFDEEIETGITNYGAAANLGYRFDLGNAAFFEPVASIAYVTSEIDDITGGGGVIAFENGSSLRAGIGAKIGTTIATGDMSTELSLLGKLWNEFEDANTVTVSGPGNATFTDGISGTFGEVAATATVTSADGGLSGFVSANGKFGEDFSSYGASAGLRVGF